MISDFRKMKYLYLFHSFFDTNSSGNIDEKDFKVAIDNIAKLRGWKPEDHQYKETEKALMAIWKALEKAADANKDGQISIEEWLSMWEDFAKNPLQPFEWQNLYCKFIFDLEDASGDGVIDSEEFSTVHECFGLHKEDSEAAFKLMVRGKKTISWEEFQGLWKEYFTSESPMDPGNFIFGAATY